MKEQLDADAVVAESASPMPLQRMTGGQAVVRYLVHEGVSHILGIFGHGNVQLGEAIAQSRDKIKYILVKNEQSAVHIAAAYAKLTGTPLAVTTSVGPGATNMVTGAAAAKINRLPVILLPGEVFADGVGPVLQQLESVQDETVNSALKPVSKYWSRVTRVEQLRRKMREAFDAMLEPGSEGPAVLCLPMDVQAESAEFDTSLYLAPVDRVYPRICEAPEKISQAADRILAARRPVIIAGGGVLRSGAQRQLVLFAERIGAPVVSTQAGIGAILHDHPLNLYSAGPTGTSCGTAMVQQADLVIGVGTRYSDFTTSNETLWGARPEFININICNFDVSKQRSFKLWGDARRTLEALLAELEGRPSTLRSTGSGTGYSNTSDYFHEIQRSLAEWMKIAESWLSRDRVPIDQTAAIDVINRHVNPESVVINAAGSLPGDLHRLWKNKDPEGKGYLMEYGYSTMGFEIAAGLGARLAMPRREVIVMVGDSSFLMASQELVTAVQQRLAFTVVVFDNHGNQSIRHLQQGSGFEDFAMEFDLADRPASEFVPVDYYLMARGMGCHALRANSRDGLKQALEEARAVRDRPTVIHLESEKDDLMGGYGGWWDVPQPELDREGKFRERRRLYEEQKKKQVIR
jgi:3D-(3,5/4)-trihydroxycyclohexane-1,2-dione acylhydrolase (decyclizing)